MAEPVTLWRSLKVGMTSDEVKRLVPEAKIPPSPSTNDIGWKELLVARIHDGGREEDIHFQFKDDKLKGVVLVAGARFGLSPLSDVAGREILAEVGRTYGAALKCRNTTDPEGRACLWIKNGEFVGSLQQPPPNGSIMLVFHEELPGDRNLLR